MKGPSDLGPIPQEEKSAIDDLAHAVVMGEKHQNHKQEFLEGTHGPFATRRVYDELEKGLEEAIKKELTAFVEKGGTIVHLSPENKEELQARVAGVVEEHFDRSLEGSYQVLPDYMGATPTVQEAWKKHYKDIDTIASDNPILKEVKDQIEDLSTSKSFDKTELAERVDTFMSSLAAFGEVEAQAAQKKDTPLTPLKDSSGFKNLNKAAQALSEELHRQIDGGAPSDSSKTLEELERDFLTRLDRFQHGESVMSTYSLDARSAVPDKVQEKSDKVLERLLKGSRATSMFQEELGGSLDTYMQSPEISEKQSLAADLITAATLSTLDSNLKKAMPEYERAYQAERQEDREVGKRVLGDVVEGFEATFKHEFAEYRRFDKKGLTPEEEVGKEELLGRIEASQKEFAEKLGSLPPEGDNIQFVQELKAQCYQNLAEYSKKYITEDKNLAPSEVRASTKMFEKLSASNDTMLSGWKDSFSKEGSFQENTMAAIAVLKGGVPDGVRSKMRAYIQSEVVAAMEKDPKLLENSEEVVSAAQKYAEEMMANLLKERHTAAPNIERDMNQMLQKGDLANMLASPERRAEILVDSRSNRIRDYANEHDRRNATEATPSEVSSSPPSYRTEDPNPASGLGTRSTSSDSQGVTEAIETTERDTKAAIQKRMSEAGIELKSYTMSSSNEEYLRTSRTKDRETFDNQKQQFEDMGLKVGDDKGTVDVQVRHETKHGERTGRKYLVVINPEKVLEALEAQTQEKPQAKEQTTPAEIPTPSYQSVVAEQGRVEEGRTAAPKDSLEEAAFKTKKMAELRDEAQETDKLAPDSRSFGQRILDGLASLLPKRFRSETAPKEFEMQESPLAPPEPPKLQTVDQVVDTVIQKLSTDPVAFAQAHPSVALTSEAEGYQENKGTQEQLDFLAKAGKEMKKQFAGREIHSLGDADKLMRDVGEAIAAPAHKSEIQKISDNIIKAAEAQMAAGAARVSDHDIAKAEGASKSAQAVHDHDDPMQKAQQAAEAVAAGLRGSGPPYDVGGGDLGGIPPDQQSSGGPTKGTSKAK